MFTLLELPYAPDALAPVISADTLSYHHGKHLRTYVTNLNAALPGSGFEDSSLEEIVVRSEGGIRNNAGQVLNHNLYFTQLGAPQAGRRPAGALLAAMERDFGSFEAFREAFTKVAVGLFGSGWAWLAADAQGNLRITQEANAGNPVQKGLIPLLTFDVWEHAYYLDWQNRRADHVAALWDLVDWKVIEKRFESR
ncbi:MAG: superoxide dismutase [Bacteroidales bacterium]|nr:superoxide dismutase [Bacteroidales bacterium]